MGKKIVLNVSEAEANILLQGLAELKLGAAFNLFNSIVAQVQAQQQEQKASEDEAA